MKLTIENLRGIIKEELEGMQQPCPDLHPKIKELLLSGVKDAIVQGFELFSALTELDIELETRTGPAAVNPKDQTNIADPRVHIEVTGPDTEKFIRCMHFDKLVSPRRLEKMIADNHLKMSFIPTGMRYSVFKQSLENK